MFVDDQPRRVNRRAIWICAIQALWVWLFALQLAAAELTFVHKGSWPGVSCGNYCAIERHQGRLYLASNSLGGRAPGKLFLQEKPADGVYFAPAIRPLIPQIFAKFTDERGNPMDFVRTIGLASDGVTCHMLLNVGNDYGTDYYNYRPAYASGPVCSELKYHGPITVDGRPQPRIFSSSMAYEVHGGRHYQVHDGGCYGQGKLCLLASDDGLNYTTLAKDIWPWPNDRPAWPELSFCGGWWLVLANSQWERETVKLIAAPSLEALVDGQVQRYWLTNRFFKGINVMCDNGRLTGIHNRQRYELDLSVLIRDR